MPDLNDYNSAARVLAAVASVAKTAIDEQIPSTDFATVISVDRVNRSAVVKYANDTTSVTIRILADDGPFGPGDIVEMVSARVNRVIYSATAPGGSYISPAMFGLIRASGGMQPNSNAEIGATYFGSNMGLPGIGNAWYLGQWSNPNLLGVVRIIVMQTGTGSTVQARYTMNIYNNQSAGSWVKIKPDVKQVIPGTGLDFALEVNIGNDAILGVTFQARVRQTGVDSATTNPIRVDIELIGNWTRNSTIQESLTTAPAVLTSYLPNWDSTTQRGKYIYMGTKNQNSPVWQSAWKNYQDGVYHPGAFQMDLKGKVRLVGLISGGTASTIFTLPPGYRPDSLLIFACDAGGNGSAEVHIDTSGNVSVLGYTNGGTNTYVSLTGISFFPVNTVIWTNVTLSANYAASTTTGVGTCRYYIDEDQIVHWTGCFKLTGSIATQLTPLTGALVPAFTEELTQLACGSGVYRIDMQATQLLVFQAVDGSSLAAFASLDGLEYVGANHTLDVFGDASASGTVNSNWSGAGHAFGSGYCSLYFVKDSANVVHWGGLGIGWASIGLQLAGMPVGYRPKMSLLFKTLSSDHVGRLDFLNGPATLSGIITISTILTGQTFGSTFYVTLKANYVAEA